MFNLTVASLAMGCAYKKEVDSMYLLICGALVVFMQAGFAMLEAGAVNLSMFEMCSSRILPCLCQWTCLLASRLRFAYGGGDTQLHR